MPYEVERRAKLVLQDTIFAGAEIEISLGISLDEALAFDAIPRDKNGRIRSKENIRKAVAILVENARPTWELTRNGEPIPPTVEGFMGLDYNLLAAIIGGWGALISGEVPAPLGEQSDDGDTSEEPPA